jgi:hypothetical protein
MYTQFCAGNILQDLGVSGRVMDCTALVHDRVKYRAFADTVINF